MAELPVDIEAAARIHTSAPADSVHRTKIDLAKLVLSQASPSASNQLQLAERFLEGNATASDLADARQDAWAYIGSLACYCSASDSASAQAVLSCLEAEGHSLPSLVEQLRRVLQCKVPHDAILRVLSVSRPVPPGS